MHRFVQCATFGDLRYMEQVDITISKNQALQILCLGYNDTVLQC